MITSKASDHFEGAVSSFAGKKIWITGHKGMLGSAMVRSLKNDGSELLLTSRTELDLANQAAVLAWIEKNRPEIVFHIAAKVGGIYANSTMPADFLYNNIMIQTNVIYGAHLFGVKKLIFVATNCTYPSEAPQPINETALMTGPLDETIRSYAVGKIAGIELCRALRKQYGCNFISVIPPNLYGLGDNYHQLHSHVIAGILRRTHEAKKNGSTELVVWGDGTPRRELLHIDDLASAMKLVMVKEFYYDLYNIGPGYDFSIAEIAEIIKKVVGYKGNIVYDKSKPNGTMRKLLDSSRIQSLGWSPEINLEIGLAGAYQDFLKRYSTSE